MLKRLPVAQADVAVPAALPSSARDNQPSPAAVADQELEEVLEAGLAGFRHLLTPKQCAALLRVSPSTLQTWRALRKGPTFVKFSRRTVRYLPSSVAAWLEAAAEAQR